MLDPKILEKECQVRDFYKPLLGDLKQGDIIFDIGANVGNITNIFLSLGAKVIAVEPEISLQKVLNFRFRTKDVIIIEKAASDTEGEEIMFIHEVGSGKNTLSEKWKDVLQNNATTRFKDVIRFSEQRLVKTTTLDKLIQSYGRPIYVKIDVEGCEFKVIRGLSSSLPIISFELNLPEFKEDGQRCLTHLNRLSTNWQLNYLKNYKKGFAFTEWVSISYFSEYLQNYQERYMEVFARSHIPLRKKANHR